MQPQDNKWRSQTTVGHEGFENDKIFKIFNDNILAVVSLLVLPRKQHKWSMPRLCRAHLGCLLVCEGLVSSAHTEHRRPCSFCNGPSDAQDVVIPLKQHICQVSDMIWLLLVLWGVVQETNNF